MISENFPYQGGYKIMQIFTTAANTFREPERYNLLLLIIIPLLLLSHELMKHQDEQEKHTSLLPAKRKNLFTQISPGVYCGSSIYQDLYQLTKNLILAIYMVWGDSIFQDVYRLSKTSLMTKNAVRGNSAHQGVGLSNCNQTKPPPPPLTGGTPFHPATLEVNLFQAILGERSQSQKHKKVSSRSLFIHRIILYIIQWPSDKIATSQEKINQSRLQWPPENLPPCRQ